jgi:hypothetical protein
MDDKTFHNIESGAEDRRHREPPDDPTANLRKEIDELVRLVEIGNKLLGLPPLPLERVAGYPACESSSRR